MPTDNTKDSDRLFRMGPTLSEVRSSYNVNRTTNPVKIVIHWEGLIKLEDCGAILFLPYSNNPVVQVNLMRRTINHQDNDSPLLSFFKKIENHTFNRNEKQDINIKTAIELAALKVLSTHDTFLTSDTEDNRKSFATAVKDLRHLVYKHQVDDCTKILDVLRACCKFLVYFAAIVFVSTVLGFMVGAFLNNAGVTFDSVGLHPLLDALQFVDDPITAGTLVGGLGGLLGLAVGAYKGVLEAKSTWAENVNRFFSAGKNPLETTTFITDIGNDTLPQPEAP